MGVTSSPAFDDAVEPMVRFLERIVTVDGTLVPLTDERGEARGGVLVGAGSLDRADCTRASRRCICAVSVRMWVSELEPGILCVPRGLTERFAGVRRGAAPVDGRLLGTRRPVLEALGLGVASTEGMRLLRVTPDTDAGVFAELAVLGRGAEASDIGGDGGS